MYYKKAISYFRPNWLMTWNEITLAGNPTRYVAVNDLIKAVKKRRLGNKENHPKQTEQWRSSNLSK
jgi:hypothetical protein